MKRRNLKSTIVLCLIGFILGFFTRFLFFVNAPTPKENKAVANQSKTLKNEAEKNEISFQKQIETLQEQNISLQQDFELTRGALSRTKRGARNSECKIKTILKDRQHTGNIQLSYPALDDIVQSTSETESGSSINDSLANEVLSYIEENRRKDSIYEVQLVQMDSILSGKDQVIESSLKAYSDLQLLFDQSLSNQKLLQKENLALKSDYRKQRVKSKLLGIGLTVLSGLTVSYLLRH